MDGDLALEGQEKPAPGPFFFNRELSWLEFNERVLGEGLRKELPPLERFKFLSIVSSNLNEFFMVRVAALKRAGDEIDPSGLTKLELLGRINQKARSILDRQYDELKNEVFPTLARKGLSIKRSGDWSLSQRTYLESFFAREVFPVLTPLRIEDEAPLPSIENNTIYAAFLLESGTDSAEHFSIMRIPQVPERLIPLPADIEIHEAELGQSCFALLEDLVEDWGVYLYPGYKVTETLVFRINRDADISVDEQRDEDFKEAMEEVLEGRGHSKAVRMICQPGSGKIRNYLAGRFSLEENDIFEVEGPLNIDKVYELIRGFDHLREKPWKIYSHPAFPEDEVIWNRIREEDVLLHLPYQSFDPVVRFFQEAALDPAVAAIKTTLYRTSGDSSIVRALEQASLAGKHVTAVVELKARFDEGRNISWANRLEKAGVIVVYGIARLKIHAKVTIVMRREYDRIKRYVHLSTGNYNDKTAKLYEDLSLFTAREDLALDAGMLFNMITGYSTVQPMGRLVIAPTALKHRFLQLISREINRSRAESPGKIMAKMNSLADKDIIQALYRASQAGVKVFLNVRGVCMLVPGVKGLSENIRVISVIDHYLEHSRVYYFANGGAEELYLASADLMTRNLERRVELMFPVLQDDLRKAILEKLLVYFKDTSNAWLLGSDGSWTRIESESGQTAFRAQTYFLSLAAKVHAAEQPNHGEFIVRRSPLTNK